MYHAEIKHNKLRWLLTVSLPVLLVLSLMVMALFTNSAAHANSVAEYSDGTHDYEVHYSVVNSSFLQPKIAKAYDIIRAPNIGVVNIAVRRKKLDGTVAAVSRISGHAQNLIGQQRTLSFSEVREQDAIYYLATFRFGHRERLSFDLDLMPDMRMGPVKLKFSNNMFVDGEN